MESSKIINNDTEFLPVANLEIEDKTLENSNLLERLPIDIQNYLCSFLEQKSMYSLSQTCKTLSNNLKQLPDEILKDIQKNTHYSQIQEALSKMIPELKEGQPIRIYLSALNGLKTNKAKLEDFENLFFCVYFVAEGYTNYKIPESEYFINLLISKYNSGHEFTSQSGLSSLINSLCYQNKYLTAVKLAKECLPEESATKLKLIFNICCKNAEIKPIQNVLNEIMTSNLTSKEKKFILDSGFTNMLEGIRFNKNPESAKLQIENTINIADILSEISNNPNIKNEKFIQIIDEIIPVHINLAKDLINQNFNLIEDTFNALKDCYINRIVSLATNSPNEMNEILENILLINHEKLRVAILSGLVQKLPEELKEKVLIQINEQNPQTCILL